MNNARCNPLVQWIQTTYSARIEHERHERQKKSGATEVFGSGFHRVKRYSAQFCVCVCVRGLVQVTKLFISPCLCVLMCVCCRCHYNCPIASAKTQCSN